MEHFVVYRSSLRPGGSLAAAGRLHARGHGQGRVLGLLNNKIWLVSGFRAGSRTVYELHGCYIARTISETPSGELLVEGNDGIDFEPPLVLSGLPWFDRARTFRAGLRNGLNRLGDPSIVDRLREAASRAKAAQGQGLAANTRSESPTLCRPTDDAETRHAAKRESSPAQRENAAVQDRAMTCALEYYRLRWKNVTDVSGREAYDIHCDDPKGRVLTVKVRGTTGGWENLLLTAAEECHARERYPDVALFILHEVSVATNSSGEIVGRGGTAHVIDPWDIALDELSPLIFGCRLARSRAAKHGAR